MSARADHVGSLLRPLELLRARQAHAAGELDHASFKRIEDLAIREVIELQEAAGCQVVTDGEFRRESFQSELTASVDGVEGVDIDAWLWGDWHSEVVGDKRVARPEALAVTGRLRRRRFLASEEFTFLRGHTDRIAKVTLPSPTLFANLWDRQRSRAAYPRFDDFMGDVVAILVDEVRELERLGGELHPVRCPALPAFDRSGLAGVLRGARLDAGALVVLRSGAR